TGSAIDACSAKATGAGSLDQVLTVGYSNNVNVGTANATASYDGDANHGGSSDSKPFTIGKATSTTLVSCTAGPFSYTGAAIEPCSVTVTGASLSLTPAVSYSNNVAAGTATASYSFTGDDNHASSADSKTFVIGKSASQTVVSCTAGPFSYTGA